MLFKPWNVTIPARYTLEDDSEASAAPPIPHVAIESSIESIQYFLVFTKNTEVLFDSLQGGTVKGKIIIEYKESIEKQPKEEEYDEYNHMYPAEISTSVHYPREVIDIVSFGDLVAVKVPHFKNVIANHAVAEALISKFAPKLWVTVSPGTTNLSQTVNKLVLKPDEKHPEITDIIPDLKPPFFLSGFGAALVSRLSYTEADCVSLLLNSEGPLGYEKIDSDAFMDASVVIADLTKSSKEYIKKLSNVVRRINGFSNSSIYI